MATLLHKLQGARPRGSKSKGNLVRQLSRDTTDARGDTSAIIGVCGMVALSAPSNAEVT